MGLLVYVPRLIAYYQEIMGVKFFVRYILGWSMDEPADSRLYHQWIPI